jgi:Rrf2 family protein
MIVDLAEHKNDGFVTLKEIADRQNISKKYLEQIVTALNKGNILQANRGFQGGYKLAVATDKLTVGDILKLTEGNMFTMPCVNGGVCNMQEDCSTAFVWHGLDKVINDYLHSVTIQDILDRKLGASDYCI